MARRKYGKPLARRGKGGPKGMGDANGMSSRELTPSLIKAAVKNITAGNFKSIAMQRLGVHRQTWTRWQTNGRKQDIKIRSGKLAYEDRTIEHDFFIAMMEASGERDSAIIDVIKNSESVEHQFRLLKAANGKLFVPPKEHEDEESGETTEADPLGLLAERLGTLVNR